LNGREARNQHRLRMLRDEIKIEAITALLRMQRPARASGIRKRDVTT
jgi:hypothetical protein